VSSASTDVSQLIQQLAAAVAAAQHRLDEAARADQEDFVHVFHAAGNLGLGTVAAACAPPRWSIERATCECRVYLQRTASRTYSIRLLPFTIGASRKYQTVASTVHAVTVDVVQLNQVATPPPATQPT
jgi:hypothetical protein